MAEKTPLMYDVKPEDFSKLNLAGVGDDEKITNAYQEAVNARKDLANSLEQRFRDPNWFKVSAGFLKPQLGGFAASLGSASDAMGENVEQQRAIAPTVAQMRASIAAQELPMTQQFSQQKGFKDYLEKYNKTKQHDPVELARLKNLNTNSSVADSIKQILESESSIAGTKNTQTNTQVNGQKAAMEYPALVLNDPIFKGTVAERSPDQVNEYLKNLNLARPSNIPENQWAAMGISDKADQVAKSAKDLQMQGMDEEQKSAFAARSSNNILSDLSYLRTLAIDEKLAPMFSLFKNGDALSMVRAYLDKNPGNAQAAIEGLTSAAMDRLKNADETTRAKADKLIKGLAKLEVNLRGSSVNPTDAFQQLNNAQSPNLANSQRGFVGILDQMGMQAKHEIDRHNYRIENNIPNRKIISATDDFENKYRDQLDALAMQDSMTTTPSWYRPKASEVKKSPVTSAARTQTASSPRITSQTAVEAEMRARGLIP